MIDGALASGALSPADVVDAGVLVETIGRSHLVYRVAVGGVPRFYLKVFGPSRGETDGDCARERAMLDLAEDRPEVAALAPSRWPWTEATGIVATAAIEGTEAWRMDRAGGGAADGVSAWTTLVGQLVHPLAAFHRATRDFASPSAPPSPHPFPASEPWPLRLMDGDAPPELWFAPATAAVLTEAAADPEVVAGIRHARSLWRRLSLIHGDLKHDNILVGDGRIRVVDWEMARIGDPAWDLAGLSVRLAVARSVGPPWQDEDLSALATLVRSYADASSLAVPGLASRLIHYAAAVLIMMSVQYGSTLDPGADRAELQDLLMKARSTFRRSRELTRALMAHCR